MPGRLLLLRFHIATISGSGLIMSRYDLMDFEWRMIKPLLPDKPRGVPRVDDWRVLNGIFRVLRSGAPWRDLPGLALNRRPLFDGFCRDLCVE